MPKRKSHRVDPRCLRAAHRAVRAHVVRGRRIAEMFEELPDRKLFPDYFIVIERPMCLAAILARIGAGEYGADCVDFANDFRLLFANAKRYNRPSSQIYKDATALDGVFWEEAGRAIPLAGGADTWAALRDGTYFSRGLGGADGADHAAKHQSALLMAGAGHDEEEEAEEACYQAGLRRRESLAQQELQSAQELTEARVQAAATERLFGTSHRTAEQVAEEKDAVAMLDSPIVVQCGGGDGGGGGGDCSGGCCCGGGTGVSAGVAAASLEELWSFR